MIPRHAELLDQAGLYPPSVQVHGFAEACDGEPPIMRGVVMRPDGLIGAYYMLRATPDGVVATLSGQVALVEATEMERERFLAEADADGGVPQSRVIKMIREHGGHHGRPEPIEAELVAELEPDPPEAVPLTELTPEQIAAISGEGWG